MSALSHKKVLLIAPRFFGYEVEIANEIMRRGAKVDFLPDRPFDYPWQAGLTLIMPFLMQPFVNHFYYKEFEKFSGTSYDLILVINGQTLAPQTLAELKANSPSARIVLYMWDSVENRPSVKKILPYLDDAFSFDPESASKYGMKLRPLFYSKGFESHIESNFDFHLSFVGTMHSDRYEVVKKLRGHLAGNINSYWYLYLQAKWVFWAYRAMKPAMRHAKISEFEFTPIGKPKVQKVFASSLAIVDIEHPDQRGLTMRSIETLGANKKLITTNFNIEQYDFFRSDNICIIDRKNPKIPSSFFDTNYKLVPPQIYYKYSLAGWLDELLEL